MAWCANTTKSLVLHGLTGTAAASSGLRSKSRPIESRFCRWCWKGLVLDKQARILEEVNTLLRDIFAQEDLVVTRATTAADVPGWDSIKQIEIVVAVEEKYGIRVKSREVDAM